jgi:site-specific DNA recombinase
MRPADKELTQAVRALRDPRPGFRGMLYRRICKRKMQAQHNNSRVYCRCRYAKEYALASHVNHPVNVYLREERLLPLVDDWLLKLFAPHRVRETIRQLAAAQPEPPPDFTPPDDTDAVIAECDTKLARYQAALDAGADPVAVAGWTKAVTAEGAAAVARVSQRPEDSVYASLSASWR